MVLKGLATVLRPINPFQDHDTPNTLTIYKDQKERKKNNVIAPISDNVCLIRWKVGMMVAPPGLEPGRLKDSRF